MRLALSLAMALAILVVFVLWVPRSFALPGFFTAAQWTKFCLGGLAAFGGGGWLVTVWKGQAVPRTFGTYALRWPRPPMSRAEFPAVFWTYVVAFAAIAVGGVVIIAWALLS